MLKRLMLGLLKGLVLGAALGGLVHFGLRWPVTPGLAGYLLAMGTGATAGVLAGRPPWRREAWLEGALKAFVGLGFGLLLYWLASRFLSAPLPFDLLGTPRTTPWIHRPILYAPIVSMLYGALVELDNTPPAKPGSGPGTVDPEVPTVGGGSQTWDT